ncbi:hypothetical protein [Emticicia sp. W12TSBA100-4]|uniref:hypothetical protein n=1 Tax=Emticicia sp. W12TSBA100-4 TaxID=3160965 RepID=UPI0033065E1E
MLPKRSFKKITSLSNYYLVRHTKTSDYLDTETGHLKSEEVPSGHMQDLSTNLLGTFKIKDLQIEFKKECEDFSYFIDYWVENTDVKMPVFEKDFSYKTDRSYFFLKISDLDGHVVPYKKSNDNFQAFCKVLHTPTNSNFWHCSVRWFDENGIDISKQSGQFKNRLFSQTRSTISEFIKQDIPEHKEISKELYM